MIGSAARSWRLALVQKVLLNDERRLTLVRGGSYDARVSGIPAASGMVDCLWNVGALDRVPLEHCPLGSWWVVFWG